MKRWLLLCAMLAWLYPAEPLHAQNQPSSAANLRLRIALEISPFFSGTNPTASRHFCVTGTSTESLTSTEIQALTQRLNPPISLQRFKPGSQQDCQFLFIQADLPQDILLALQHPTDKTLVIADGANALEYGADVAILRSGNHHAIRLNLARIKKKGLTVHAQLLKIAKALE